MKLTLENVSEDLYENEGIERHSVEMPPHDRPSINELLEAFRALMTVLGYSHVTIDESIVDPGRDGWIVYDNDKGDRAIELLQGYMDYIDDPMEWDDGWLPAVRALLAEGVDTNTP